MFWFYVYFVISIFCFLVAVALLFICIGLISEGEISYGAGTGIVILALLIALGGWKVMKVSFSYRKSVKLDQQKKVVVLPVNPVVSQPASKEMSLEEKIKAKITEISDLRAQLQNKQEQIVNLLDLYIKGIGEIRQEILNEIKNKQINSFESAISDQRIHFDLTLIQRRLAYIQKLNEISQRIKLGIIELEFKEREAEDDLALAKVLPREEIEKFVGEINELIKKYQPETSELVIKIDEETMLSHRRIWDEIIVGNKTKLNELILPATNPLPESTAEQHQ